MVLFVFCILQLLIIHIFHTYISQASEFLSINPLICTRPKPVEHGYVFSMAVGTIGEWLKLVPFFVRGRTVDSGGGADF